MAESESESKLDEMELAELQKAISAVETKLASAGAGKPMPLVQFVDNARGRIAALERKIKDSQIQREARAQEQLAVVNLAQKETALSASEKESFSGFLSKEFFAKSDFGSLEKFYSNAWDRLSQTGKDEMSHRIWEGVRRDEYKFSELPKAVREKETQQAYHLIRHPSAGVDGVSQIPAKDRDDFIRAFESGSKEEASKVLERESFRKNMFKGAESKANNHMEVERGREASGGAIEKRVATRANPDNKPHSGQKAEAAADIDLSALTLNGVKLADAPPAPCATNIPLADGSTAKSGPVRGGG